MAGELAPAPETTPVADAPPAEPKAASTVTAVPTSSAPQDPTGASQSSSGGLVNGVKQAGDDFVAWWYQSHGALFDVQMASLDASGVKREFIGYGLVALFAILQLTRFGPFLANAFVIAYPLATSLALARAPRAEEGKKWLIYWSIFGLFSLLDITNLSLSAAYWIAKVTISAWLFLPQTQGALVAYALILKPAVNFIDTNIVKKFV